MARMIPAVISGDTASPGEKRLFDRFGKEEGTDDWIVLHSFNLPKHVTQVEGECDFVILVPGLGILCLEVKAHLSVSRDNDGLWHLGKQDTTTRGPFQQAKDNMRSLMKIIESRRADLASAIVVWSAVAFTHTDFREPAIEWNEWEVIDRAQLQRHSLSELVARVLVHARELLPTKAVEGRPSAADCDAIANLLRRSFEVFQTPTQRRDEAAAALQAFTEEQYRAIDGMRHYDRVVFEGPAGTGKTLLALEAARRASAKGESAALICFNRLLGTWLQTQTRALPGVSTATIHSLMLRTAAVQVPNPQPTSYFENVLPELAVNALLESRERVLFDILVVDEAQDILRDQYLDFLDMCVKGGLDRGRWLFFGDFFQQALYESADIDLDAFLTERSGVGAYSLGVNCRNTQRIANWVTMMSSLKPGYSSVRRPDPGFPPRMHYFGERESQIHTLQEKLLPALYDAGFKGQDIVLLSPYRDCAAAALHSPWKDRLRTCETASASGRIRYSTISAFKGLEAPVVILTDIVGVADNHSRSLFYTGATRATEQLHVLASDRLREQFLELIERPAGGTAVV